MTPSTISRICWFSKYIPFVYCAPSLVPHPYLSHDHFSPASLLFWPLYSILQKHQILFLLLKISYKFPFELPTKSKLWPMPMTVCIIGPSSYSNIISHKFSYSHIVVPPVSSKCQASFYFKAFLHLEWSWLKPSLYSHLCVNAPSSRRLPWPSSQKHTITSPYFNSLHGLPDIYLLICSIFTYFFKSIFSSYHVNFMRAKALTCSLLCPNTWHKVGIPQKFLNE